MTQNNPIRLTDKLIIERELDSGRETMTIDGYDLKEFTLDLQSAFTTEVEQAIAKLQGQASSIETDLYFFINAETDHYVELSERITDQDSEVSRNRVSIDVSKELIDELYETTRIIGKYLFVDKEPGEMLPGEMVANFVDQGAGRDLQSFPNIKNFYFHTYDRLFVESGYPFPMSSSTGKSFKNLFEGDIIEISTGNSVAFTSRATYIVTKVTSIETPGPDAYGEVEVEVIESAGDAGDFPFSKIEATDDPERPEIANTYRVEVFPSVPTASFADKLDYEEAVRATVPIGMVVAWFQATTKIPTGWMVCDGSTIPSGDEYNDIRTLGFTRTPNLKGRALIGSGSYGINGVNNNVDQTTSKPKNTPTTSSAGGHTHTATITSAGNHYHTYGDKNNTGGGSSTKAKSAQSSGGSHKTSYNGSHTHESNISDAGSHSHTISGWDTYNRMYAQSCHYIMKVKHV